MNHKWKDITTEKDKKEWKSVHICTRGDCNCIKHTSKHNFPLYSRSGINYEYSPDCYGDIKLNDQTID